MLVGSRFAARSLPLCVPSLLQHFRPYESQFRNGVDALARGQPFKRKEQVDPEEQGQHESSRAVRVLCRFLGGLLYGPRNRVHESTLYSNRISSLTREYRILDFKFNY